MYSIYLLTNQHNRKYYVGLTKVSPEKRWERHVKGRNGEKQSKTLLSRAINKYGKGAFVIETLATVATKEQACELEKLWIRALQANDRNYGYNLTTGGDGAHGRTGWHHSLETKEKIRQAHLGRKFSLEWCENLSKSKLAAKHRDTPEQRKRKSDGHKGVGYRTDVSEQEIRNLYMSGTSVREIMRLWDVSETTVYRRLKLPKTDVSRSFTPIDLDKLKIMYESEVPLIDIAARFNVSRAVIIRRLSKLNVKRRRDNKDYRSRIGH